MRRFLLISLGFHTLFLLPFLGKSCSFPRVNVPAPGGQPASGGGAVMVEIVGTSDRREITALPPNLPSVQPEFDRSLRQAERIKSDSSRTHSLSSPSGLASLGSGSGSGEGIGAGSGSDAGVNLILAEIRTRIERAKRYPELARESDITGKALVSFSINGQGRPEEIRLETSSGSSILDEESLATIKRAAPFPAYADQLSVWISFRLD